MLCSSIALANGRGARLAAEITKQSLQRLIGRRVLIDEKVPGKYIYTAGRIKDVVFDTDRNLFRFEIDMRVGHSADQFDPEGTETINIERVVGYQQDPEPSAYTPLYRPSRHSMKVGIQPPLGLGVNNSTHKGVPHARVSVISTYRDEELHEVLVEKILGWHGEVVHDEPYLVLVKTPLHRSMYENSVPIPADVINKLAGVENELAGVENELAGVENENELADVENKLADVENENELADVENKLAGVENELAGVENELADVENENELADVENELAGDDLADVENELAGNELAGVGK